MKDVIVGIGAIFLAFIIGVISFSLIFGGIIIVLGLIWAIPTMLLWDWLMPELFGLSTITIWQAWGLNILAGIFFKNKEQGKIIKETSTTKKKPFLFS